MPSIKDLVLIFSVAEVKFAIAVKELLEVAEGLKVSGGRGAGLLGTVDFRGEQVPLLDIADRLRIGPHAGLSCPMLVVRMDGRTAAFPVDAVFGVAGTTDSLLPFPDWMMTEEGLYSSVFDKDGEFILLLDLKRLFDESFFRGIGAA